MHVNRTAHVVALAAAVVVLALVLAACGSSGSEVGAGGAQTHPGAAATPPGPAGPGNGNGSGNGSGNAGGSKSVSYRGLSFSVPGDWPVYDLESDPSTCVRFDVHAVYLGHPGADMKCPAVVVGHTDAVLVEPTDGSSAAANGVAHASVAGQVNGLSVATDRSDVQEHEVHATFPGQGVTATVSFTTEDLANQVLGSFKAAGH